MRRALVCLPLLACIALAGCLSRPRAVVVDRSTEPAESRSVRHDPSRPRREYLVVRGDTLYGIAFRHDVDFRDLARWNRIPPPYTIYPGQRLTLGVDARIARLPPAPTRTRTPPTATLPPGDRSITQMPVPAASTRPLPPTTPVPPPPVAATPPSTPAATAPAPTLATRGVSWRWPASGQLVSRYVGGDPTRQGINIAGNTGQPVLAAAAGEVVYSGAGLIGYGELVIIKHSEEYLSAYGHNRKRLVAEGQRVAAGQQIAEMGRSGAARDMLHFEIRRNGKPIDPMPLLPKR
jgi:lipoprotein NlpD